MNYVHLEKSGSFIFQRVLWENHDEIFLKNYGISLHIFSRENPGIKFRQKFMGYFMTTCRVQVLY